MQRVPSARSRQTPSLCILVAEFLSAGGLGGMVAKERNGKRKKHVEACLMCLGLGDT